MAKLEKPRLKTFMSMDSLWYEEERLATFIDWPVPFILPIDLAREGFYYLRTKDHCACAFCRGVIGMWEAGDTPKGEHKKHFPECALVQGKVTPNVPITQGNILSKVTWDLVKDPIKKSFSGADVCGITKDSTFDRFSKFFNRENVIQKSPVSPLPMSSLGLRQYTGPKRKEYITTDVRLNSFKSWPDKVTQTPLELAESGFYYCGLSDHVRCFHCGNGLRNWESNDKPWEEHARWFPDCNYVLLVKGIDFIDKVRREKPPYYKTKTPVGYNDTTKLLKKYSLDLSDDDMEALMQLHIMRHALEMGFSQDLVKKALRQRLEQTGQPFFSLRTCTDSIISIMENERETVSLQTDESRVICNQSNPPANPIVGSSSSYSIMSPRNFNSYADRSSSPGSSGLNTTIYPTLPNNNTVSPLPSFSPVMRASPPLRSSTPTSQVEYRATEASPIREVSISNAPIMNDVTMVTNSTFFNPVSAHNHADSLSASIPTSNSMSPGSLSAGQTSDSLSISTDTSIPPALSRISDSRWSSTDTYMTPSMSFHGFADTSIPPALSRNFSNSQSMSTQDELLESPVSTMTEPVHQVSTVPEQTGYEVSTVSEPFDLQVPIVSELFDLQASSVQNNSLHVEHNIVTEPQAIVQERDIIPIDREQFNFDTLELVETANAFTDIASEDVVEQTGTTPVSSVDVEMHPEPSYQAFDATTDPSLTTLGQISSASVENQTAPSSIAVEPSYPALPASYQALDATTDPSLTTLGQISSASVENQTAPSSIAVEPSYPALPASYQAFDATTDRSLTTLGQISSASAENQTASSSIAVETLTMDQTVPNSVSGISVENSTIGQTAGGPNQTTSSGYSESILREIAPIISEADTVIEEAAQLLANPMATLSCTATPLNMSSETSAVPLLPSLDGESVQTNDHECNYKMKLERLCESRMCRVCMDKEMNVVFLPCRHMVACFQCAVALTSCPVCRSEIIYAFKPIVS